MNQMVNDSYTVGVGLTDLCNASCPHCYSRPQANYHDLDFDKLLRLADRVPISSVNFGTGESILYPRLIEVIEELDRRGIEVAVTTNGTTIIDLPDDTIKLFHDVDFSLDFPDPMLNDKWRGVGAYQCIMSGIERCRDLGVEASLVACLMKENAPYMGDLARLAVDLGLNLRVNVYKSIITRKHQPDYAEFWSAIRDMAEASYFSACSEPVVAAALKRGNSVKGNPCGQMSFRIHPDGKIVPCVYLSESDVTIDHLIADFDRYKEKLNHDLQLDLPDICRDCEVVEFCHGGCASRRILRDPAQPDEYCFKLRDDVPRIDARWKKSKGLVHENYLCTMIFTG